MHNNLSAEKINVLRQDARTIVRELGLLNDAYCDIGVTLAERHLLIELESCVYPDVGSIAEKLLLDKSTASRLIAKAVKKKFVVYATDDRDKRRRRLQITKKGRETLEAFEPLAQKHVKDALLVLSEEEVQLVHQGIALFSKGLNKSRRRKEFTLEVIAPQDNVELGHLITTIMEDHGYHSTGSQDPELLAMYEAYQKKGCAYFVIKSRGKVAGGAGIAPLKGGNGTTCELRKMYLQADARELGLGHLLLETCLREAKQLGYRKCYLETAEEMVNAQNLYLRHGFVPVERKGTTNRWGCSLFSEKTLK